jgi:hypothetical protein
MSASKSTKCEEVDDQKGKFMVFVRRREVRAFMFPATACMSLRSGTESTNEVSHMRWNISTKPW